MKQEEEFSEIRMLLRQKSLEQPPAEYFDRFLSEFQRRQRAELLQRSAHSIFFERMATYFSGLGGQKWAYGAGLAYASVMLVVFALPNRQPAPALAGGESVSEGESILWDGDVSLVQPVRFDGGAGSPAVSPPSFLISPTSPLDGVGVEAGPRARRPVLPPGEVLRSFSNPAVVPVATEL